MFSLTDLGVTWEKTKLSNGIPVHFFKKKGSPVTFYIAFPYGSKDDPIGKFGIVHLLEHLVLKSEIGNSDINLELEKLGGILNGGTWPDMMDLHVTLGDADDIGKVVKLFNTALTDFSISDKNFEIEKNVVLQELGGHNGSPEQFVWNLYQKSMYSGTFYQHPVLGEESDLKSISMVDIKSVLSNMLNLQPVIFVTGDFDTQKVYSSIESHFDLGKSTSPGLLTTINPEKPRNVVKITEEKFVNAFYSFGACGYFHDDMATLDFISESFSSSFTAILLNEVRKKLGLVYWISSGNYSYMNGGDFSITFGTENKNLPKLLEKLDEIIDAVKENGLSNAQLAFTKKFFNKSIKPRYEKVFSVGFYHVFGEVYGPEKYPTLEQFINKVQGITNEEIIRIANKYFIPENHGISAIGNLNEENAPFLKDAVRM